MARVRARIKEDHGERQLALMPPERDASGRRCQ